MVSSNKTTPSCSTKKPSSFWKNSMRIEILCSNPLLALEKWICLKEKGPEHKWICSLIIHSCFCPFAENTIRNGEASPTFMSRESGTVSSISVRASLSISVLRHCSRVLQTPQLHEKDRTKKRGRVKKNRYMVFSLRSERFALMFVGKREVGGVLFVVADDLDGIVASFAHVFGLNAHNVPPCMGNVEMNSSCANL